MIKKVILIFFSFTILFLIVNRSPFFYFKRVKFKTEELEIVYHYKWNLVTGIPIKRKISISNHITNLRNSQKLIDDPENFDGFNEVRFYKIKNKVVEGKGRLDILLIQDGWTITILNWNTLDLLEQNNAQIEEVMKIQFTEEEKECIGKIQKSLFLPKNCELKFS
jgi:hypothetical protein